MAESEVPGKQHFFEKLDTDYANNVAFETTVWDLKLVFGEYSDQDKEIDWHTSITIPWAQAKLMQYYLQVNIEAFESVHGKIRVPSAMIPPDVPKPDPNDSASKQFYDIVQRLRAEFLAKQSPL